MGKLLAAGRWHAGGLGAGKPQGSLQSLEIQVEGADRVVRPREPLRRLTKGLEPGWEKGWEQTGQLPAGTLGEGGHFSRALADQTTRGQPSP